MKRVTMSEVITRDNDAENKIDAVMQRLEGEPEKVKVAYYITKKADMALQEICNRRKLSGMKKGDVSKSGIVNELIMQEYKNTTKE